MPDSPAQPSPPRFGNHEVLLGEDGAELLLGEGSFGKTYKARHIFLGTDAALKVIRPSPETFEKAKTQFLKEARAAAQLRHPHIAMIIDFGESQGALYYAMEYCAGGDLHRFIEKNGKFDVDAALPLFRQSAGALLCAHKRGFLHRDLKPSNFLFATPEPPLDVKLIDFGLVKEFISAPRSGPGETQGPVTETAHFVGTPLFASPEQIREEILDERSDIFSLGMTWWFLLTGKPAFSGSTARVIAERLSSASYADLLPDHLPLDLRDLLGSMVAKERSLRPANVSEILERLHAMGPAEKTVISVPARITRSSQWFTRPGKLLSHFEIEGRSEPAPGGTIAPAVEVSDGRKVWLLVFDDPAVSTPEEREQILKKAQAFAKIESENLMPILELLRADDGYAVVFARDPGTPLLNVLKASGHLPFSECVEQLRALAKTVDAIKMAGLPAVDLAPHALLADAKTQQEGFNAPGARILIRPVLVESSKPADDFDQTSGATMIVDSSAAGSPLQAFAALIYRLVSGRALSAAARVTPDAFTTVPALSEEGNRILADAVANSAAPSTCADLLARLCEAEGIDPGAGTSSGSSLGPVRVGSLFRSSSVSLTVDPSASASLQSPVPSPATVSARTAPVSKPAEPPSRAAQQPAKSSRPSIATSKPQEHVLIPAALGIAAAIGAALVIAGLLIWRFQPAKDGERKTPKTVATPAPLPAPEPARERPKAPEFFTFTGTIIPRVVTFKVEGLPVTPSVGERGIKVPLASAGGLPLKIQITAPGFREKVIEVTESSGSEYSEPIRLARATGEIAFKLTGSVRDYVEATFKMIEALPGETGVRPEASPYTFPISGSSKKLATGIYEVILRGSDHTIVQPRKLSGLVEVREGVTTEIVVPPSAAATYAGQDPGGGPVELVIDPDLRGGRITRSIGAPSHPLPLKDLRLDNEGTIAAETVPDPQGVVWRIELAQAASNAKPVLTISNALTPPGKSPSPPIKIEMERR